jgi:hypothetical protein
VHFDEIYYFGIYATIIRQIEFYILEKHEGIMALA